MQLQALGFKPFLILFVLVAIGPVIAALVMKRQVGTFNHVGVWSVLALSGLALGAICFSMMNREVEVAGGRITVKSTFYSTSVPLREVTAVDVVAAGAPGDPVGTRVNGVGLPGFSSGWFSSKAGGRVFVDRASGDYVLISVGGKPALALQFADPVAAAGNLNSSVKEAT